MFEAILFIFIVWLFVFTIMFVKDNEESDSAKEIIIFISIIVVVLYTIMQAILL